MVRHGVEQGPALTRSVALIAAVGLSALLVWNAFHYPWRRSYDASASAHYALALGHEHRLPTKSESAVWHNPPLFFIAAGALTLTGEHLGYGNAERLVQLLSAAAILALVLLTVAIARELTDQRTAMLTFAVLALTPVVIRAGALFHPEPLAAALTTAGVLCVVRSLERRSLGTTAAVVGGVLLALGALTRTWGLAAIAGILCALVLAWWWSRDRGLIRYGAVLTSSVVVLVAPWLTYKAVHYGNPLAYSQPNPEQWRQHGRPASFYFDFGGRALWSTPYVANFRNRLVPVVYADWWGDYWRNWPPVPGANDAAPAPVHSRWRQSVAGIPLTLAALAGLVLLSVRALRRHDAALAALLLASAAVVGSFVAFLVGYPKQDGDNIKALYLLDAVPAIAIAAAFFLGRLWTRRYGPPLIVATFAFVAVLELPFIVLRG